MDAKAELKALEKKPRKKKLQNMWRKGALRFTPGRKIEDARWVRDGRGGRRLKIDRVSEPKWLEHRREALGWRNGARVTPRPMTADVGEIALAIRKGRAAARAYWEQRAAA